MSNRPEQATDAVGAGPLARFCAAVAEDLRALALLHDRELERDMLLSLRKDCYEDFLGLELRGAKGREALALFREGLSDIPSALDQGTLDILAAEFADIYLNNGLGTSPCESVWLDEDGLIMQEPMFQIRQWYRRYGVAVEDWRKRTDDHLVNQLQFLAILLETEPGAERLEAAARFMDEHLLRWIEEFGERVATRSQVRFYAGLAFLTAAYLGELRDLMAELLGSPRPSAEEIEERMHPKAGVAVAGPAPFVPGAAPTW
ncbi:MAG: molecular chaperone TorD family protein [Pseudomonadota bacterium]|nr:molecular chaperone TorD family protein [Pseudomonadota bacterium]